MKAHAVTAVVVGLILCTPAGAQVQLVADSTGSPSAGTATVSPSSVNEAFARHDAGDTFGISLGTAYASGKFGADSRSHLWTTALGVRYVRGGLRLNASIPYMRIRSAGTIYSGIDSTPVLVSTTSPGIKQTRDGLADLTLGASYIVPLKQDGPELEFSGRVKLPTASNSSGLSTGKTDYSGGVQLTQQIGPVAPFASVTYRMFGDRRDVRLRDGLAASAGTSFVVSDNVVALASYHYSRSATRLVDDAHELFAGASYLVPGTGLRVNGFATAGLSRGAAATSGGLSLSVDFGS
ncbi:hypothetical protein [uncultured Sphingomonas sp.]|uniref:hypothetical protein n=1 Tax=uncultured Sphingomonas sp. TaxID=158754 RepID=UPI0025FF564B|nr:hypothetical protein [uncultured Sphingomonas sp.]